MPVVFFVGDDRKRSLLRSFVAHLKLHDAALHREFCAPFLGTDAALCDLGACFTSEAAGQNPLYFSVDVNGLMSTDKGS